MDKSHLQSLIAQEIEAIQQIPFDGTLNQAIDLIHEKVHGTSGKVIVSGVGKAGHIGISISTTLCSTGTTACFLPPLDAQHGDLGLIQNKDVLFLISNSGETREILELIEQSKGLQPEIPIIGLTGKAESTLAKESNVVLYTGETKEICPLGLTPTTSTTVMSVIGDLLVVGLMEKINFDKTAYGLRHHSGYLGKKARQT